MKTCRELVNSLPAEFSLSPMLNEAMSIAAEQFGDNVSMRSVNVVNNDEQGGKPKKKHSIFSSQRKKKSEAMEIQFTFNPQLVQQVQEQHRLQTEELM